MREGTVVRLWMIAEALMYTDLQREGQLWTDPVRSDPDYRPAYDWMCRQMATRIPGYTGHLPWWAWRQHHPRHRKPDLHDRTLAYFAPGTTSVRLDLDVPDEEVLLNDFLLWNDVLNDGYLAWSERESDGWNALPPQEQTRERLEASWDHIFTLEYPEEADPVWMGSQHAERIQGTFETLRFRNVRGVTRFVSRPIGWPRGPNAQITSNALRRRC